MTSPHKDSVVAVGALGGSGTRAVAELLIQSGIYMGNTLNQANDNMAFALLFKNPKWFRQTSKEDIRKHIKAFEGFMKTGIFNEPGLDIIKENSSRDTLDYSPRIIPRITNEPRPDNPRINWGWKEPNTHIFLEHLVEYFPKFKYIHVLRHGLDMAFAPNKKQLFNWGYLFDIDAEPGGDENTLAKKQLDYWIRSTRSIIERGRELLADNFFLLRYEDLCLNPEVEVSQVMSFLKTEDYDMDRLKKIPKLSENHHRYKKHELGIFTEQQLSSVEELGFEI